MHNQLFHHALHVRTLREAGNASGPHHDTHRNNEDGRVHHALCAINSLRDRQSQETGIGNDRAILHDTLYFLRLMIIKNLAENIAY